MDPIQEPINTESVLEVGEWCYAYAKRSWPVDPIQRYAIGIYQVSQAMHWTQSPHYTVAIPQAWAAMTIHFLGAASLCDAYPILHLPDKWTGIQRYGSYERLLHHISTAQQQIWYMRGTLQGQLRRSRANPETLAKELAGAIECAVGMTRRDDFGKGVQLEMDLLVKKAWLYERNPKAK